MILVSLLLMALPQVDVHDYQHSKAQQWWSTLTEEQQQEYLQRQKNWKKLGDSRRHLMSEKHKAMRAKMEEIRNSMSEEQLKKFGNLDQHEQRAYLHDQARMQMPGHGRPPERGPAGSPDLQRHEQRIRQALADAQSNGWIGEKTGAWLETASLEEAMQVLLEVRKWQFLEKANAEQFWQNNKIDLAQKNMLIAMPGEHFFRGLHQIMSGDHNILGPKRDNRRNAPPRKLSPRRKGQ
ncbi:MAG: hypothetical protein H8E25_07795 [Planctomycetes bacterium]|nr:hypothetical protein [Planctomycetota bacterium]